jgi:hypothetical protein
VARSGQRRGRHIETRNYWTGRAVEPLDVVELGDLVRRHGASGIELRAVSNLWPTWNRVVASSLEFSGIRLRNALPPAGS